VTGYIFTVDPVRFEFIRRPDPRTRIVSLLSGDILVNIIPLAVDLDKVIYQQEAKAVRVTDGSNWQHGDDLLSLESEDVVRLAHAQWSSTGMRMALTPFLSARSPTRRAN
jgi:hypothetical protein